MNVYITLHLNDDGTYDVYFYSPDNTPYACMLHGGTKEVLQYTVYANLLGGYIKLSEGDTFELHIVDEMWTGDYHKAVYTASGGEITAIEHGINTTVSQVA